MSMWYVPNDDGELIPLAVLSARAKCDELLVGHDTTHGGAEYPFCEDYGCGSILAIREELADGE